MSRPLSVAFVNENALGHGSYLPRFARALAARPHLGIEGHSIDVLPLPEPLRRQADRSIRGLRKAGLDFHIARWRRVTSRQARNLVDQLLQRTRLDALVVNTQSVALDLLDLAPSIPVLVGLDATFAQLSRSPWFAPNPVASAFLPLTVGPLLRRERRLFRAVSRFLAWSGPVRDSLVDEYGIPSSRIEILPPSLDLEALRPRAGPSGPSPVGLPRILFVGGDFVRKGGPLLLEVFRRQFRGRAELHLVTQAEIAGEPGVFVHREVRAGSGPWLELWQRADIFVFPSRLETFGIVLLEALAFEVPIIAARVGAAAEILEEGRLGCLLPLRTASSMITALEHALEHRAESRAIAEAGRERLRRDFDLDTNAARLAGWLRACAATSPAS